MDSKPGALTHVLDQRRGISSILVVGCGGTGSAFASGLPYFQQSLMVQSLAPMKVTLVDPDKVSPANCVRQPFARSEIGQYKAVVIAERINLFWGFDWQAAPTGLTEETQGDFDILVTCVDSRAARNAITRSPLFQKVVYWLDIGNNADHGQFVLGQPKNKRNQTTPHRLPTVAELYPEIINPRLDEKDPLPSCSAIEALRRQEPFVNPILANHALFLLTRLFRHGQINHQGGFVNPATGRMSSIPIQWRERKRRERKYE